jgi:hypothetical protein
MQPWTRRRPWLSDAMRQLPLDGWLAVCVPLHVCVCVLGDVDRFLSQEANPMLVLN